MSLLNSDTVAGWSAIKPEPSSFTPKKIFVAVDEDRIKPMSLSGQEFIRRLLLHVLPQGFTKIRHYGILGNNRRHSQVPLARAALENSPLRWVQAPASSPSRLDPQASPWTCPHCEGTQLRCIGRVSRRSNKHQSYSAAIMVASAVDHARKANPKSKCNTKSFRQHFLSAQGGWTKLMKHRILPPLTYERRIHEQLHPTGSASPCLGPQGS
jgi:Putative transposase